VPVTYTFNDIVRALNAVQPHDWTKFLRTRLDGHGPGAPLDGIARGGYKLVYKDKPTDYDKDDQTARKITDLTYSIGVVIGREGRLSQVLWNGPAHGAGLTAGTRIIAVNGVDFETDGIKDAIAAARKSGAPIELLVKNGDRYRTVKIDYRGGLRYPHLERDESKAALLDQILAPRD
jgi:predicted metalloprotease with PDZ domain